MIRLVVMMYVLGNREKQEIGRTGRVAISYDLKTALHCHNPAERREVAIGLTAPFKFILSSTSLRDPERQRWNFKTVNAGSICPGGQLW